MPGVRHRHSGRAQILLSGVLQSGEQTWKGHRDRRHAVDAIKQRQDRRYELEDTDVLPDAPEFDPLDPPALGVQGL